MTKYEYENVERPLTLIALRKKAREVLGEQPPPRDFMTDPLRLEITLTELVALMADPLPGMIWRSQYRGNGVNSAKDREIGRVEKWAIDVFVPAEEDGQLSAKMGMEAAWETAWTAVRFGAATAESARKLFDAGVMAERERCARVAETCENDALPDHHWPWVIAAAIRKEPS